MPLIMQVQILAQVGLVMVLGRLVGYDREQAQKPAGLRTHMLVCGGTALLIRLTEILVSAAGLPADVIRTDPLSMLEAVITGVSFLGAGTIIRSPNK